MLIWALCFLTAFTGLKLLLADIPFRELIPGIGRERAGLKRVCFLLQEIEEGLLVIIPAETVLLFKAFNFRVIGFFMEILKNGALFCKLRKGNSVRHAKGPLTFLGDKIDHLRGGYLFKLLPILVLLS